MECVWEKTLDFGVRVGGESGFVGCGVDGQRGGKFGLISSAGFGERGLMQHGWDGLVDFFRKLKARGGLQEALNYLDGAMGGAAVDFKTGRCGMDH